MGINTYEVMYIQARDNYPYNVEECIEKLQYVIAADDEHAGAHYLMGQIYEEQLTDYKQAEHYYRMTLYLDKNFAPVYHQFAMMLINLNRIDEAYQVIEKGYHIPGVSEAKMNYLKGLLYEKYEMYNTAIDLYTQAKFGALNSDFICNMDDNIRRVKNKKALKKKLHKKLKAEISAKKKKEKDAS